MRWNKCVLVLVAVIAFLPAYGSSNGSPLLMRPGSPSVHELMSQVNAMREELELFREQAATRKQIADATSRLAVYSFQNVLTKVKIDSVDDVANDYLFQFNALQVPSQGFAVHSICLWTAKRYLHDYQNSVGRGRAKEKLRDAAREWFSKVDRAHVGYELEELYRDVAKEFGLSWDTSPVIGYHGLF